MNTTAAPAAHHIFLWLKPVTASWRRRRKPLARASRTPPARPLTALAAYRIRNRDGKSEPHLSSDLGSLYNGAHHHYHRIRFCYYRRVCLTYTPCARTARPRAPTNAAARTDAQLLIGVWLGPDAGLQLCTLKLYGLILHDVSVIQTQDCIFHAVSTL